MKLKPVKRKIPQPTPEETPKVREKKPNKLPSDEYRPLLEPVRFLVRETTSYKDPTKVIKQYIEVTVKRFDSDDELGLPHICMQMYQESEFYTGYLKGKSIYLPLESGYDLLEHLEDIFEQCEDKGLIE